MAENRIHKNEELSINLNCQSLLPIIDELHTIFELSKPLFIAATKTWLKNSITDMEVNINDIRVERRDRQHHGGGVAIYVRSGLKYERMVDPLDPNIEVICIEFKLHRKLPCLLICAY